MSCFDDTYFFDPVVALFISGKKDRRLLPASFDGDELSACWSAGTPRTIESKGCPAGPSVVYYDFSSSRWQLLCGCSNQTL